MIFPYRPQFVWRTERRSLKISQQIWKGYPWR